MKRRRICDKKIQIDKRYLTIQMTVEEYAKLIGHSEGYVRRFCVRDDVADTVQVRIPTSELLEDICDVRKA